MVKLYLSENTSGVKSDDEGKYIDICLTSIMKADLISSIIYTTIFLVGFSVLSILLAFVVNII